MFNTTAKTNIFGLTPGQEYTVFKVAPNGMDASSSFLVSINGNYRWVAMENFTSTSYKKF